LCRLTFLVGIRDSLSLKASCRDRLYHFVWDHVVEVQLVEDHLVEEVDLPTLHVIVLSTTARLASLVLYLRRWMMCLGSAVLRGRGH
jgi:hypothetical protein